MKLAECHLQSTAPYSQGKPYKVDKESQELSGKPQADSPLATSLKKVLKSIENAIEMEKVYQLGRRRIQAQLIKEKKALEILIQEVTGVAVTQDEKLTARHKKGGKDANITTRKIPDVN